MAEEKTGAQLLLDSLERHGVKDIFFLTDVPVVLEIRTDPREHILPMIPAGKSHEGIIVPE